MTGEMAMARTVEDDRKAGFLRLYEQYAPALGRLAAAYTNTPADRQDLVQEIAAAVWQALPNYRGEASERTWLYRIAHNVAITFSARRRTLGGREAELVDAPSDARTAEQQLLAGEKRRLLIQAIRNLPAPDRQLVVLHLEEMSYVEIADVTGLSPGVLATRLTRVREKLRKAVRAKEAGDER